MRLPFFDLPGPPLRALSTPVTAQSVPAAPSSPPPCATLTDDPDAPPVVVERRGGAAYLDVRGLASPEPLRRILEAVADPANLPLVVRHHRDPVLLYPRLAERGLGWATRAVEGGVELRIHAE